LKARIPESRISEEKPENRISGVSRGFPTKYFSEKILEIFPGNFLGHVLLFSCYGTVDSSACRHWNPRGGGFGGRLNRLRTACWGGGSLYVYMSPFRRPWGTRPVRRAGMRGTLSFHCAPLRGVGSVLRAPFALLKPWLRQSILRKVGKFGPGRPVPIALSRCAQVLFLHAQVRIGARQVRIGAQRCFRRARPPPCAHRSTCAHLESATPTHSGPAPCARTSSGFPLKLYKIKRAQRGSRSRKMGNRDPGPARTMRSVAYTPPYALPIPAPPLLRYVLIIITILS